MPTSSANTSSALPHDKARREVAAATKNSNLVRDRREQLIRAAITVFEEKGFHGTTVRDIGRAANLTQGTIYNYVRTKEDILFLVCDRIVNDYLDSVSQACAAEGDAMTRLKRSLKGLAQVMLDHRSGILMLYHESYNLGRESRRAVLSKIDEFIRSIEVLLDEVGQTTPLNLPDRKFSANIVTFLPAIFALRSWSIKPEASNEQLIAMLTDFMAAGLGLPHGIAG